MRGGGVGVEQPQRRGPASLLRDMGHICAFFFVQNRLLREGITADTVTIRVWQMACQQPLAGVTEGGGDVVAGWSLGLPRHLNCLRKYVP